MTTAPFEIIIPIAMLNTDTQRIEKELDLQAPWHIVENTLKTTKENLQEHHIKIAFTRGSKFKDKTGTPCPIHNTLPKIWRHIDFAKDKVYIHCKVPRIKTTDGKVQVIDVPWARSGSRFSWAFESNIMRKIRNGNSFDSIGSLFNKDSHIIWNIFNGCVDEIYTKDEIDKELSTIGIDEISDQEKGKQVTITIDLKNERVLRVTQGIGKDSLQDVRTYLETKNVLPEQIKHVSGPLSSGSQNFFSVLEEVKTYFPNAEYHIDLLYIVRLLNDAMDQIRKKESYRTKNLTLAWALFVKHPTLLSDNQKKEVQKLSAQFPNVGQAYELKNEFFMLWDQSSPKTTEAFLESWYQKVSKTKFSPLKRAAKLLKTHKQYIVRFSELPTNSTVMEKIHQDIRTATSRTKGLKNFENVSNMIYFCCGKLTFPYTES